MRYPINSGSIEVLKGDITDQDTEAIVNAANNHFWMGAGVAGAIKRKGGVVIEREAVDQGPVEIGGAVITSAGSLKAQYVIHAAVMGQDLHTDAAYIKTATHNALLCAEKKSLASISFPSLGTGVGGFSVFHCAKIMLTEAIEFLLSAKHLCHVRFILIDDDAYQAFEQELKLQFSAKRH
jgi:O-acetyl-ADP-ribose deacetylase (regulator of RNase III)